MSEVLVAFCTFPDVDCAATVTKELVGERLVACGNILPAVQSIYRWHNAVESSEEVLAMFKLDWTRYEDFEKKVKSMHPYEVPEIIAFPLTKGLPAYLDWVTKSCA